jgi:hypothetical protein
LALLTPGCAGGGAKNKTLAEPAGAAAAVLRVYAYDGDSERVFLLPNLGHAFVSLSNTGDAAVELPGLRLLPGEEITIGTWGQRAHWGIWYNVEARYMSIGHYKGVISLAKPVTADGIAAMADYMRGNDRWTFGENCSKFAMSLWNSAAGRDALAVDGVVTPNKLKRQIENYSAAETDRAVEPALPTGFLDEDGNFIQAVLQEEAE